MTMAQPNSALDTAPSRTSTATSATPARILVYGVVGLIALALALAPFLFPDIRSQEVAARICVFIVLVASYDLLIGYTGLPSLGRLGRPLCVGVSRKSFIGALTGRADPADRLAGSLAATTVAVLRGAALIRAHDVRETVDAVRVAERLREAAP